jgi:hypothetical protein
VKQEELLSMLNSILWSRNILHGTKLTVYNAIVKSILTYGAEIWTVKQKHRNGLFKALSKDIKDG